MNQRETMHTGRTIEEILELVRRIVGRETDASTTHTARFANAVGNSTAQSNNAIAAVFQQSASASDCA